MLLFVQFLTNHMIKFYLSSALMRPISNESCGRIVPKLCSYLYLGIIYLLQKQHFHFEFNTRWRILKLNFHSILKNYLRCLFTILIDVVKFDLSHTIRNSFFMKTNFQNSLMIFIKPRMTTSISSESIKL